MIMNADFFSEVLVKLSTQSDFTSCFAAAFMAGYFVLSAKIELSL
jgi:hypothetical protein